MTVLLQDLLKATLETTQMTGIGLILSVLLGIPLGLVLFLTGKGLLWENRVFALGGNLLVNFLRSLPFVILLILVLPLASFLTGRSTGPLAASVPLAIAAIAFYARLVQVSLAEVDRGVIEAAVACGATHWHIIRHVLLPEAFPGLLRGFTVTAVSLIGYSAMAGVVGGGGVGFLAINYGYYRYETGVMIVTVIALVIVVQAIQSLGDWAANKKDHKIRD
ncbi:MAG: methionine ABC transporter permease [Kiritimatiellia bacterium]